RAESYLLLARGFDLRQIHGTVIGNLITLAHLYAQYAGKVPGVFARNLGVAVPHLVHKESSSHSFRGPVILSSNDLAPARQPSRKAPQSSRHRCAWGGL